MAVALLLLAAVAVINYADGQMNPAHFGDFIEPYCFNRTLNGVLYIQGQEKPLANTLENFINLVEKLEIANPDLKLRDEVFLLLRNYTFENMLPRGRGIAPWIPEGSDYQLYIQNLWEPDENKRNLVPDHIDPFSFSERCSLFFMLSHTVTDTELRNDLPAEFFAVTGSARAMFSDVKKFQKPQEYGVVAIEMTDHAVALSRVIMGIYLGLNQNRKKSLSELIGSKFSRVPLPNKDNLIVDPLYSLTLADMISITKFPLHVRPKEYGGNGKWKSVIFDSDIQADDVCPTIYELLENAVAPYTYSSFRGGIDGLILGEIIDQVYRDSSEQVKLSNILRMYYSHRGIPEQSTTPVSTSPASFCHRGDRIGPLTEVLNEQIGLFLLMLSSDYRNFLDIKQNAYNYFDTKKREIFDLNKDLSEFCRNIPSLENLDKLPCETVSDVIVVMDSSSEVNTEFKTQQLIIGHLANFLKLSHNSGSMTVLLDQQNGTSGLHLNHVVENTNSSACAACYVAQMNTKDITGSSDKVFIIQAIDKLLDEKKKLQKDLNGVAGKAVIYFNFNAEEAEPSYRFNSVLRDMFLRHQDVSFFAVGRSYEVLKKYARYTLYNFVDGLNGDPKDIAYSLSKKICEAPATLQYEDCMQATSESSAVHEGFVTPNAVQHWAMFPNYFYKSYKAKIFFDVTEGNIQVCHSRANSKTEAVQKHCFKTNSTTRQLKFEHPNPCKGFTDLTCAPFFFSVIGVEEKEKQTRYCQNTRDIKCETLDQIKFKVSHEGIRCSRSSGLFSSFFLLTLMSVFYLIYIKQH